jgi:hypothetical protein
MWMRLGACRLAVVPSRNGEEISANCFFSLRIDR